MAEYLRFLTLGSCRVLTFCGWVQIWVKVTGLSCKFSVDWYLYVLMLLYPYIQNGVSENVALIDFRFQEICADSLQDSLAKCGFFD